jgi:hypothetical protein
MLFVTVRRFVLIALLLSVVLVASEPLPALAIPDPCGDVQDEPDPPLQPPSPLVAGTVVDADSQSGISGATMKVFQCSEGEATYVETVYTGQNGAYSSSTLSPGYFYYVEAVLTGPLAGMNTSGGTENPSDAVGLGASVTDVDFEFDD